MTNVPTASDDSPPREWSISTRTLIVSADSKRVLAVLNERYPLLLPPGTVLQFNGPPGELMVTRIRVTASQAGGIVCAETKPAPKPGEDPSPAAAAWPAERSTHLPSAPSRPPRWTHIRPGNG